MDYTVALTSELVAIRFAQRGLHEQAYRAFMDAGDGYSEAGLCLKAAACYASADREAQWRRPTPPTNVSALVD